MNVFKVNPSVAPRWVEKCHLDPAVLVRWRREFEQAGLDPGYTRLTGHVNREELRRILLDNEVLVQSFAQALQAESPLVDWSHLLLLTDRRGIVLAAGGSPEVLDNSRRIGIETGTRFDLPYAGLNAIAMAVRLQQPVFLRGDEHDMLLFRDWSCLCMPISAGGETFGFVDVSFPYRGNDPGTEIALAELYLNVLKERLAKKCPQRRRSALDRQFREYGLSPREREIAYYWVLNLDGLQIAAQLGITENTVRSVIKNIYRKTSVSDKGQFIRRFLA